MFNLKKIKIIGEAASADEEAGATVTAELKKLSRREYTRILGKLSTVTKHVTYRVRYYRRFHAAAVGLGTYYPWIRGHYCILYTQTGPVFAHGTKFAKKKKKDKRRFAIV
jgi:hypothetical protein